MSFVYIFVDNETAFDNAIDICSLISDVDFVFSCHDIWM